MKNLKFDLGKIDLSKIDPMLAGGLGIGMFVGSAIGNKFGFLRGRKFGKSETIIQTQKLLIDILNERLDEQEKGDE